MKRALVLVLGLGVWIACSGSPAPPSGPAAAQRLQASAAAVAALQATKFADAEREAAAVLARDPHDARAAAVHAITRYQAAGHRLFGDLERIVREADVLKALDHERGRAMWTSLLADLDAVDRDLAIVAADRDFALELCLACWERDWNRNGEIDDNDRRLFQVEVDTAGNDLPAGDPRRRPTFRLDVGDADWARAMVAFQRAGVELVLAYRWTELDKLVGGDDSGRLVIPLADARRVTRAHELILAGLAFADRCRDAYLAETDDDREWVPSPRQKSYAVPLPVDEALYAQWAAITGDVRRLLKSEEGISMRAVAALLEDNPALIAMVPDAYVDLGAMLRAPREIVVDFTAVQQQGGPQVEQFLRGILGNGFRTRMKPTPLVGRLRQMKTELSRGEDDVDRKLRYLLWLN